MQRVKQLQKQIQNSSFSPFSISHSTTHSNTTRSKKYKKGCHQLDCSALNRVIHIDPLKEVAKVEPLVTMHQLVEATLPFGLVPKVVPEFKGITVGGAIMGAAAESSSHRWGLFHDTCLGCELLIGDGSLLKVSPTENRDIFYGISGSYGSLGLLISAEIQLCKIKKNVHLRYRVFSNPLEALSFLISEINNIDFIDGIIFSKDLAVVIEGKMTSETPSHTSPSQWYAYHVEQLVQNKQSTFEEIMSLPEYLFRYDQGAFWMGAFLCNLSFLARYLGQGLLKLWRSPGFFNKKELDRFRKISSPNRFKQTLFRPLMKSQRLWGLLHKAEKWVQDRLVIQDCCIPASNSALFLTDVLDDPGTFPLWLCPIKGTDQPQIFAPHLLPDTSLETHLINVGIYGVPSSSIPMEKITRNLEQKTREYKGRKVLYSRSYYTSEEFWAIYSHPEYQSLRHKLSAHGIWHEITEKVLSE